ncbi:MAG: exodeoxyribonuclease VII large subunit [Bacteroidales bacterium]|nr:exodeoxyribonuclease VII large subunit [Bacteroidales bacterium]
MDDGISLSELSAIIEQGLKQTLSPHYWVVGEISEIQDNRNGHCYLELIEKPDDEQNPTAKMRAVVWANVYRMLSPYFESETGSRLSVGMKILVQVSVNFHPLYGFSLQITDINPTYTIGEEEQRRQKIIRQLEDEGIIDLNKEIPLPSVIQRIAVISSETAAGYQDFMQQLQYNLHGIAFHTELFPAAMQGVEVEKTVIAQLDEIFKRERDFDAVVIIRGGGARTDLRWFDSYEIAANVAQFPLPVITGIGHDKDQSITDLVAHTSLKTPTAVAEFIINTCSEFIEQLNELQDRLQTTLSDEIRAQHDLLNNYISALSHRMQLVTMQSNNKLLHIRQTLQHSAQTILLKAANDIQLAETRIIAKEPKTILKQGYTLTTSPDGTIVRSSKQLKANDKITTHFADGTVSSTIN